MVIDPTTGKQVLKMVTKQIVGKETLQDIMRLAGIFFQLNSNNNSSKIYSSFCIKLT